VHLFQRSKKELAGYRLGAAGGQPSLQAWGIHQGLPELAIGTHPSPHLASFLGWRHVARAAYFFHSTAGKGLLRLCANGKKAALTCTGTAAFFG
jgi:hypothetical protein